MEGGRGREVRHLVLVGMFGVREVDCLVEGSGMGAP